MTRDAQTLAICRQLLFIQHEQEALVEHDEYAPEAESPNHERYKALLAERATLWRALTKASPPTTKRGIQALAELAWMTFPDRTFEERLCDPGDFATWVALFALSSAAGKPEAIPLPDYLPDYWPA
jgi:hypothetical protein